MATRIFLALTLITCGSAAAVFGQGKSFLGTSMQPEVVARTLSRVEDEWKAQAAVFAECSTTAGLPGASIVNCADAPSTFEKSCNTVVSAIIQGSGGDKDVTKEYMEDVCGQRSISGWHQQQCHTLAIAVRGAMSADKYQNRVSFNTGKLCNGFWTNFLKEEQDRAAQEKAEREAAEKKEAEEAAEKEKLHQEELKKQAERKKEEQAAREKQEAAAKEAEAKAKAAEAAARVAEKKAEAEATAQAAKQKKEEAEAAEVEHKKAVAKVSSTSEEAKTSQAANAKAASKETAVKAEAKAEVASPKVEAVKAAVATPEVSKKPAEVTATKEAPKEAAPANTAVVKKAKA